MGITSFSTNYFNLICHHKGGVEAHAELADHIRRRLAAAARLGELLRKRLGARARDRAEVLDELVARHADARVRDGQGVVRGVWNEVNLQSLLRLEDGRVREALEADLVQRIAGVRDELAQEDILAREECGRREVRLGRDEEAGRAEARGSCIRRNKHKQERQVEKKKRANGKEMGGVP